MNESYKTKQKDLIIKAIKKQKQEFKVQDIYEFLDKKVGLTTIYRLVDKMTKDGELSKNIGKDNITYYQYLEKCNHENHFYLKCQRCGSLEHVDCDCIIDLMRHIFFEHNFKINHENIIIKGICENCQKEIEV